MHADINYEDSGRYQMAQLKRIAVVMAIALGAVSVSVTPAAADPVQKNWIWR